MGQFQNDALLNFRDESLSIPVRQTRSYQCDFNPEPLFQYGKPFLDPHLATPQHSRLDDVVKSLK